MGFVLRAIERTAKYGFRCRIGPETLRLYPRVGAIALDTPERVKYFGLRGTRACGICRLRRGRSATRCATRHRPDEIESLYRESNMEAHTRASISTRKRARERLHRHGFNYKKKCRLNDYCKHSLVNIDTFGSELYSGLIRYERMHVYFLNYCTYCLELISQCVPARCFGIVGNIVRQCHQFRDPITGKTHPRLPSVLKMTHLTAERRVRSVFYWAHVLGTQADVIVQPCRRHVQIAVSTLQLLLIATRGHRPYSRREMNLIFRDVGGQFFRSLEIISEHLDRERTNRMARLHEDNPDRYQPHVPFQRNARYTYYTYMSSCVPYMLYI